MGLFACCSGMKDQAVAKGQELKKQHEEKQQAKWREEVLLEDATHYKDFEGWVEVYEKAKGTGETDEEDSGPNALEQKARAKAKQKMTNTIKGNILKALMETVSQLLGPAAEAMKEEEPEIADFLNAGNGAALTFRFLEAGGEKRMAYVRRLAAGRVVLTLGAAVDAAAAASGHAPDVELSEEQIQAVVDSLVGKALAEVEKKQAEAAEALKNAPLFAQAADAAGEDGAAAVDAGVVALQDFLRGYMESKIGVITDTLREVLSGVALVAAKNRAVIQEHAVELAKQAEEALEQKAADAAEADADGESGEGGGGAADEAEPELSPFEKVQQEILDEIEGSYAKLDTAVGGYVGDLVGMVVRDDAGANDEAGPVNTAE